MSGTDGRGLTILLTAAVAALGLGVLAAVAGLGWALMH